MRARGTGHPGSPSGNELERENRMRKRKKTRRRRIEKVLGSITESER